MSSVYQLEPATEGKVLLTTTHGEIEIELWAKECPKACRNFVQLCLEGYYDGVIWHRIIKDFMIQTGDPTGTGRGGDSIYGEPFKDELHSRIKFNHRGQVAMANSGAKDTNGSQFFITLERTDWIDRKHTIFGKVVGHTIYNAIQIAEVETDGDRPVEPFPKILKTEVLWNPFDDIVPRSTRPLEGDVDAVERKRRKKKETKKLNLLSFGEEAGEEEAEIATMARPKAKSVFDASGAGEDGGRIVKPGSEEEAAAVAADAEELARSKAFRERMRQKLAAREAAQAEGVAHESDGDDGDGPGASGRGANEAMEFEERMRRDVTERRAALDDAGLAEAEARATAAEDKTRRKEEKAARKAKKEEERREREATKLRKLGIGKARLSTEDAALMTEREARRVETKRKRNVVAGREKDMLAKLAKFQNNLKGALKRDAAEKKTVETESNAREGAAGVSRFVSEGLYYAEEEEEEDDGGDWKAHALSFVRDERKDPHAYLASMDDYVVEDPLLEKGKGKFAKADKAKKRENAWAGGSLT